MPKSLPCCHFLFFLQTSIITHGEIGQWGRQKLSRAKGTSSYELVCRITIPEFGHGPQFPTNTLVERWTMLNLQASGTSSSSWSPSKISKGPSLLGIWCQRGWKTAQSIELVGPCCAMVPCKLSLQLRFWSATKKIWHVFAPILSFFDGWNFGYESVEWAMWSPWPLLSSHYCLSFVVLLVNSSGSFVS